MDSESITILSEAYQRPWRYVLATWWPRLLPGIAAGSTHGVIRVSHAVRTLLAAEPALPAITELGYGLAFWAARFRVLPAPGAPPGCPTRTASSRTGSGGERLWTCRGRLVRR